MTHTTNRKRRERSFIRVERIYPALIEGRMARGHRSLDGPEPWLPKLHGWRNGGYVTDDRFAVNVFNGRDYDFLQRRAQIDWGDAQARTDAATADAVKKYVESSGYEVTPEQERFLQLPPGTPLFIAPLGTSPSGRTGRAG